MDNIKKMYKEKNFLINTLVLKNVRNLKIDIDELLLLLYFINVEESLDLAKIKEYINFTDEEILNVYSNLLAKGLIEVKTFKNNGIFSEKISLDVFYDKLILGAKEDVKTNEDIYSKFENEFGRSLSPMEYETINRWISSGVKEELIVEALREAVINNVRNLRYIDKIIYEWTKKTMRPKEESEELFDYDWLEDTDE
ncbi:MAG: DnaD domain protein [Tenericutes bacterium]|nr:DnaD domain protein [Mycoplasmatota bacterium]